MKKRLILFGLTAALLCSVSPATAATPNCASSLAQSSLPSLIRVFVEAIGGYNLGVMEICPRIIG